MEALMKELGGSVPGASTSQPGASGDDAERDRALLKAWEAMLAEDMDGAAAGTTTDASKTLASGSAKGPDAGVEDAFQKTIREAMDRMKENEDVLKVRKHLPSPPSLSILASQASLNYYHSPNLLISIYWGPDYVLFQASDQSAGGTDSSLTALLSSLGDLEGLGGEGSESGEELQGMLESMMTQLMSKEVIYEPLKELHEKVRYIANFIFFYAQLSFHMAQFPAYLSNNASTLSADDQARYTAQQNCVTKIIAVFENPHYSDEDTKMASDVVTLMNEVHGTPIIWLSLAHSRFTDAISRLTTIRTYGPTSYRF